MFSTLYDSFKLGQKRKYVRSSKLGQICNAAANVRVYSGRDGSL